MASKKEWDEFNRNVQRGMEEGQYSIHSAETTGETTEEGTIQAYDFALDIMLGIMAAHVEHVDRGDDQTSVYFTQTELEQWKKKYKINLEQKRAWEERVDENGKTYHVSGEVDISVVLKRVEGT
jgi:hypothetical protein